MSNCLYYFRLFIVALGFIAGEKAAGQYYYTDVVALQQDRQYYATLKKNGITLVTAISNDDAGAPVANFMYKRELKDNPAASITITRLNNNEESTVTAYYQNNRLIRTVDSSDKVLTTTEYKYSSDGILAINSITNDAFMDVNSTERHSWFYSSGKPDSMVRIKNSSDTTFVYFVKDSSNNITEETWQRQGRLVEHYYYYYNDQNMLTDIVRYNSRAKQMLPDYLFNYKPTGQLMEVTQVPQGFANYTTWQYEYSDKGLKTQDILLDKRHTLLGTIIYSYK